MAAPAPPLRAAPRRGAWVGRSILIVLAAAGGIALWAAGLPGHESTPNWFYPVRWRGLDASPLALALALSIPALVAWTLDAAARRRHALALASLVALSLAAQSASLLLVGPELQTAFERFEGGHAEFLVAAHAHEGRVIETLRAYPERSAEGALGAFAPSKPPGTLAFYAVVDAIGADEGVRDVLRPLRRRVVTRPRLRRIADGATAGIVLFPLFTALTVLPIVWLGAALGGRASIGYAAALIWATCPAVLVVTHHTDGALYPLLATLACALAAQGARRGSLGLSALAGVPLALAIWSSYGLLPVIGLALGAQLVAGLDARRGRGPASASAHVATHALALGVGLAAALGGLFAGGLFREPIEGYRTAMEYHYRWKLGFVGGRYGLTGGFEFWAWVGLPMLVAFVVACARGLRTIASPASRPPALAALGVLAVHLVLMLYAGSNESARLWLFQIPFLAVVIAADLRAASPVGRPDALVWLLVVANLALVPVVRAGQPW